MMKTSYAPRFFAFFVSLLLNFTTQSQEVVFSRGEIKLAPKSGDSFVSFEKGKIQYGNIIQTGSDGLAIISFPEGSKLKVDPNSEIEIGERVAADQTTDTDASWSLKVLKGALTVDFKKKIDGEKLYVESNKFAVGVRGTRFLVAKESSDDWHVAVNEGQVTAFNKETYDYEDIKPGQGLVLEKGASLTKPASFEWTKKLDWDVSKKGQASRFFSKELRSKRRAEIKERLKKLRKRNKRQLRGRLRNTLRERVKRRRGLLKDNLKGRRSQMSKKAAKKANGNKKQKLKRVKKSSPQNFRDRMRKRKVLRRRRN